MKSRCRQAFVLLITAITVTLTGCSIFDKTDYDEYISPSNQAENNLVTIVEAINKQDSSAIKQLLSSNLVSNHEDIDSRIDEMIDFIDGEIISYDDPFGSACGGFEKKDTGAKIQCLLTDNGTEFYIAIKQWYSYDEQPEQVGVYNITVKNLSMLSSDPESTDAIFRLMEES